MSERAVAPAGDAELRLPRPPGIFRRWLAAHPFAVDVAIVVCYLFGCGLMLVIDAAGATSAGTAAPTPVEAGLLGFYLGMPSYLQWPLVLLSLLRTGAVATALLLRRRFPLAGLIVTVLALFGDQSAQSVANSVALVFLLYAVPVYRSVPAGWLGYGIALAGSIAVYLLPGGMDSSPAEVNYTGPDGAIVTETIGPFAFTWGEFIAASVMTALWYLAILMLGINLGNRRRYLAAIIDRAHQLARERDQLAQLAVAEERSRIAREMHDIVAHSVSVMIALSEGASRVVEAAPEAASDAMRRSAETGRTALAEMRRLLGALSEPAEGAAEFVPQPGVNDLPELVRNFRDAGLDASLVVRGDASGDRGQDLAVYRVVQEGLTNVLRYAGHGARAEVAVERLADRTVVEVRDHGRVDSEPGPVAGLGSGRGLRGLAERVRVFGGTIESGPVLGGGWRLRAILPVSSDARDLGAAGGGGPIPQTENEGERQ
ncbi:two-component sensor histidine kinase [Leucobacter sp. CSA1]|uniref:histidine kinase n=1 Tax=Leucobacter chromiisoli TaxID=2796471 RepID=A0A934Q575_9MICO|nr:histidine kinase [Leucobacter chromiisoli]MBK0418635.1 two-component sensor histidine kinase [Leucobacter chromiisoli]